MIGKNDDRMTVSIENISFYHNHEEIEQLDPTHRFHFAVLLLVESNAHKLVS